MGTALVVEDSLTDIQILVGCLRQSGIDVLIAQSGEDAITTMAQQRPDVIVLDVVLPGRSGFQVCRQLKGDPNTRDIPVIMCSTKDTEMDKFWGLKQGADAYLTKPIDQVEFIDTIQRLINPQL
jgi:two-component system, chemotaxis family, response regulator PixH